MNQQASFDDLAPTDSLEPGTSQTTVLPPVPMFSITFGAGINGFVIREHADPSTQEKEK